jgi:Protein of unknown function (DUF1554)
MLRPGETEMFARMTRAGGWLGILICISCGGSELVDADWTLALALQGAAAAPDYTTINRNVEPPEFLRIYIPGDSEGVAKPHNGNWGGISGADAYCNLSHASKPTDPVGSFKALLVDGFYRVATTVPVEYAGDVTAGQTDWPLLPEQAYKDMAGNYIGTTTDQAFFGTYLADDIRAVSADQRAEIWTGLRQDWTLNKAMHCEGWTSSEPGYGQSGRSYDITNAFSSGHKQCYLDHTHYVTAFVPFSLFCVEQPAEPLLQRPAWNIVLNEYVLWIPPCDITPAGRSVVVHTSAPPGATIHISSARDGMDLLERTRMGREIAPPNGSYALGDLHMTPRQGEAVVRNQQVVYRSASHASGADQLAYTTVGDRSGPGCTVELTVYFER